MVRGLLAVLNIVALATVLLWPLLSYGGIFLFDNPSPENLTATWVFFLSVLLYPVPVVAGNVAFWVCFFRKSVPGFLWAWTSLSFAGPLLVLLLFFFGPLS